jgi:hypothetical protein
MTAAAAIHIVTAFSGAFLAGPNVAGLLAGAFLAGATILFAYYQKLSRV